MTGAINEWVVYSPPKSVSFGHQSRVRDPRKAWPTVEQFLMGLEQRQWGAIPSSHAMVPWQLPEFRRRD